jgi:hypothetical protein
MLSPTKLLKLQLLHWLKLHWPMAITEVAYKSASPERPVPRATASTIVRTAHGTVGNVGAHMVAGNCTFNSDPL